MSLRIPPFPTLCDRCARWEGGRKATHAGLARDMRYVCMYVRVVAGGRMISPRIHSMCVFQAQGCSILGINRFLHFEVCVCGVSCSILDDARDRLLKPGGQLIPCSGRVFAQLIEVRSPSQLPGFAAPTTVSVWIPSFRSSATLENGRSYWSE